MSTTLWAVTCVSFAAFNPAHCLTGDFLLLTAGLTYVDK